MGIGVKFENMDLQNKALVLKIIKNARLVIIGLSVLVLLFNPGATSI